METRFRFASHCIYFLFIICPVLVLTPFALAATKDTLEQGDKLDFSTYLVSAKKTFTLGFFNLEKWWYLGIWYTADPDLTRVWVANRNTPILHNSGTLTLDSSGKLKITSDEGVDFFQLYSHHPAITNVSATLQDDGNFVLRELSAGHGTEKRVLWQSFEYPTDTLLPGMKLGISENTGKNWHLTSWLTDSDPSVGAFTLEWDPGRGSLLVRRRRELYWTSGALKNRQFSFIDRVKDAFSYDFINVSTAGEDYFMYAATKGNYSKWVLDFEGIIYEHREEVELAYADACYGFNTDGGCERWAVPGCRIDPSFIFDIPGPPPKENYKVYISETGNASLSDCRYNCWQNCDCVGFNTIGSHSTGCVYWSEKQMNYSVYSGSVDYGQFLTYATPKSSTGNGTNQTVQASESKPHESKGVGRKKWVWIGTFVSVTVLILVMAGFICLMAKLFKQEGNNEEKADEYILELVSSDPHRTAYSHELQNEGRGHNLTVYSFEDIKVATDNFADDNQLGQGGFGVVYKGILPKGREIAVKRLTEGSNQGIVEFRNELILIAELQHKNLVRLIGCCIHGEEKMLIYEYMPNKSLDYFLFDETRSQILDWPKRFNIIEGTAQGLLYLHKHSRLKVIHRDMKASNILLDQEMDPKISDFGMARIFTQNTLVGNTMRVVGTYGYMSPEYAMEGIFSEKSDVFSFGVMVLEIVSGKRNYSFYMEDCPLNLVGYAWELWNDGAALELLDDHLKDSCLQQDVEQLLRCIQVGLLCVQDSAAVRPYVSEVVLMLSNANATLPVPEKPAYVTGRSNLQVGNVNLLIGMSGTSSDSVNGVSLSVIKPR